MKVLVTGATGFVGLHTARRLVAAGHTVHALVRDHAKAQRCLTPLGITNDAIVVGDMTDAYAVGRALEGADAVVHAAAAVSVTVAGAASAFEDNVTGTERVLGGAAERGIDRMVYVSSAAALFDPKADRITADSRLAESTTRYGRSKVASDRFVRSLRDRGVRIAVVYPSGVIGPDDPGMSESVRAYRKFLKGMLATTTSGTQFVDVRDLAAVNVALLEAGADGRHAAVGPYYTWNELAELLERVLGARIPRIRMPGWLLRGVGHAADAVGRMAGREMPISAEALRIATQWRPIADSASIAELGIRYRAPEETIADMFAWFVRHRRLSASSVPALNVEPSVE